MKHNKRIENYRNFGAPYWKVLLFLVMLAASFQTAAQQTIYIANANNTYKVLQLKNNSLSNGTPVVMGDRMDWDSPYKTQQEWYYDNATNTIRLKANPNKCLARRDQQSMNSDPIILVDYSPNNDAQRWVLENHQIKLLANKNVCIGLANTNYNVDNPAMLQDASINSDYQKWYFREKPAQTFTADGQLHRVNSPGETYTEFVIPNPCPYPYVRIQARGGDGGVRSVKDLFTQKEVIKARGGEGALMAGTFKIGTGAGELKPGTTLRFVIGRGGESLRNNAQAIGGGGGGGTGVIYEAPGIRASSGFSYYPWEMLVVAGGGGGSYSDCCATHHDGLPANNDTRVSHYKIEGSTISYEEYNGWCGNNDLVPDGKHDYFFASGFREDSDPTKPNHNLNDAGSGFKYTDGGMIFPVGGKNVHNDRFGGYGFGGGGTSGQGVVYYYAGGGGGYSGGSPYENTGPGGGGGSYLNAEWVVPYSSSSVKNGTTATTADGYVEYQFTNDGPVTCDRYLQADKGTEVRVLETNGWVLLWQYDGNLVLYQNGVAKWASNTQNKGLALRFQGDGNLVIYQNGVAIWNTGTDDNHHNGKGGRKLVLTPEGSLYIVDQDGKTIWQGH